MKDKVHKGNTTTKGRVEVATMDRVEVATMDKVYRHKDSEDLEAKVIMLMRPNVEKSMEVAK